jgi:hypothetical protein
VRSRRSWRFWTFGVACPISLLGTLLAAHAWYCSAVWGYPFLPPSSRNITRLLSRVDRFSAFDRDGGCTSGRNALQAANAPARVWLGETPMGSVPDALERAGLQPASDDSVPSNLVWTVIDTLAARGILERDVETKKVPRYWRGYAALGRLARAGPGLVVALRGPDVSGDCYPYYEGAFELLPGGETRLLRLQHYGFDEAGAEGLAPLIAAMFAFPIAVLWLLAFLVTIVVTRLRRRFAIQAPAPAPRPL